MAKQRTAAPAMERSAFAEHFDRRVAAARGNEPAWLLDRRRAAFERFEALGFPGPNDEEWRQTSVAPIAGTAFAAVDPAPRGSVRRDDVRAGWADGPRLVIVNGRLDEDLSSLEGLPAGVELRGLAGAAATSPVIAASFDGLPSHVESPFAALNAALWTEGAFVRVPKGVVADRPLHVLHVTLPSSTPASWHPRTLVIAEDGAMLTLTETYLGSTDGRYFTNAVTEIVAGENAEVRHVRVQAESVEASHVGRVQGRQAANARIVSHNLSWGAALARHDVGSTLEGAGAECRLYGIYLADGRQHVDNHTCLDHASPHCPSWELYKGILGGASRAVFNGRIIVRPDAQKTDAKQSNRNLLVSDEALVHTRPQLEIYANDVRCTHGATVGRLDDDALFYLQARGVGRDEARDLLIHAFAGEVLDAVRSDDLRRALADELWRRLPRGARG